MFHKAVASGNDFILVDHRKSAIKDLAGFAKKYCAFHYGVGADGVLLIEPSRKADFFMRIINSDGSEAEACGNGYRCVGLYAHKILGFPRQMKFDTLSGMIELEVGSVKGSTGEVKVRMVDPSDYRQKVILKNLGGKLDLHCAFINTGVPHAVIFTEALEAIDVPALGPKIRHHEAFGPRGTNVNFAQLGGENRVLIRTYERGVEDETLACGTGTVAAAVIAGMTGRVSSPVHVTTKGGEVLTVAFEKTASGVRNVYLEGSAEIVFEGHLTV